MLKYIGCDSLQTSLRLRGAGSGYRIYYAMPGHINPNYNRHWFCNIFSLIHLVGYVLFLSLYG